MGKPDNWRIIERIFPENNYNHQETVFTTGNGYFSSRGSFEEGYPGEIATTFLHGVFNDVPVYKTELVNFPKWFAMKVRFEEEEFRLDKGIILSYRRELDMVQGLLTRNISWQSPQGRRATIQFSRFIDMANIHHGALRFVISSINFSGKIFLQAAIPGVVDNENYRHWIHSGQGQMAEDGCFLELVTTQTAIKAAIAQVVRFDHDKKYSSQYWDATWMPTLCYECDVEPGDTLSGTKHALIYTSREVEDPTAEAVAGASSCVKGRFDLSLAENQTVWQNLWDRSNVVIEGDDLVDRALRYNLFQVLVAAPRHDDTVSIGAKTLSGYGYRGHVFWDTEIFVLPFLIYTQPEIARNLLMYRFHTLPGARAKAKKNGYQGAMYAWESASSGEEVTPTWVTGPEDRLIRIWCGDIEQHITADVVYGIHQYWHATGDDYFMRDYGAEIVLSAAQFLASRLEWDSSTKMYHIRDVIGPDEYHEHVDDNTMTNLMAKWVLVSSKDVANWLKANSQETYRELLDKLSLGEEEIHAWREKADNIACFTRSDGVIEQFKDYFDLTFLDQSSLEPREQSLQALFGIEGIQKYQFIKQPDVVMALYLLRDWFDEQQINQNLSFYSPRTDLSYGSSLGPSIQALMLARFGNIEDAKALLIKTLLTDLENNRGNSPDGIHAASAGAVWQVLFFGFLGFDVEEDTPIVTPRLPKGWERVRVKIHWKNQPIVFDIK